ncbi:MAG: hypothetical protein U0Q55_17315 [Vicinamibacterales bacterium]
MVRWVVGAVVPLVAIRIVLPTPPGVALPPASRGQAATTFAGLIGFVTIRMLWSVALAAPASMERS